MSKLTAALFALILAVVGFAIGYRVAPAPAPEAEAPAHAPTHDLVEGLPPGPARAALKVVLEKTDPFERIVGLGTLLPTLGPDAVLSVRSMLQSHYLYLSAAETELLVRFWARHDPKAATEWALTKVPVPLRVPALRAALERWAAVDPNAAIARLEALGKRNPVREVQAALILGWYMSGLPGLEQFIDELGVGFDRQRALAVYVGARIQREGAAPVIAWADAVPDEPWRYKIAVYRNLSSELARLDLDAAKEWCKRHCDEDKSPHNSNLRARIAAVWARQDGPAAFGWLSHEPRNKETDEAVKAVFRAWSWDDEAALIRWLDEHMSLDDVPAWFRPAVGPYALAISWDRPAEALKWAEHIENEKDRNSVMVTIARRWREVDPKAAEAWVASSPLDDEHRAEARTFPKNFQGHADHKRRMERRGQEAAEPGDESATLGAEPDAG